MANLILNGPYPLDLETIDKTIQKKSAGVYVLGYQVESITLPTYEMNVVKVRFVGRSDEDLKEELKKHVGKYPIFKYHYLESPNRAYEEECRLWHYLGGGTDELDNETHPMKTTKITSKCLKCNL